MKVFLYASVAEPVGIPKNVLTLACSLRRFGHDAVVLAPRHGWLTEAAARSGVPVECIPLKPSPFGICTANIRLLRFLREQNGLVVLHANGRATLFASILAMLFCRKVRVLYSVRLFTKIYRPGLLGWKNKLESFLVRRLPFVHAVSEALKADVVEQMALSPERVHVIANYLLRSQISGRVNANSIDKKSESSMSKRSPSDCALRVIAVGRLSREKGFDLLVEALAEEPCRSISVIADIYGKGPQQQSLQTLIETERLRDRVVLKGEIDDIYSLLRDYDVVVIPSRSETFGVVALEAFMAGIPVIASDIPGLKEVTGGSAAQFAPGSASSLAECLIAVANNPDLREKLGAAGRQRLEKEFSEDVVFPRFLHLYKTVAFSGGRTGILSG